MTRREDDDVKTAAPATIEGVCSYAEFAPTGGDPNTAVDLLIEVPHGATLASHYESARQRLESTLPPRLEEFFFVNTDVGAPEVATHLAQLLRESPHRLRIALLRGLVPRTFIDLNRELELDFDHYRQARLTAAVPDYITSDADIAWLTSSHRDYQTMADRAYERACGGGGHALMLHTYAPRSVGIERVGADIVEALHEAYRPEVFANWPRRPEVDLISRNARGECLSDPELVAAVRRRYDDAGIEITDSRTYRLDAASAGYRHATRYPRRTLCIELNRELLAEPFRPFEQMTIGNERVRRMTAPLADALIEIRGTQKSQ